MSVTSDGSPLRGSFRQKMEHIKDFDENFGTCRRCKAVPLCRLSPIPQANKGSHRYNGATVSVSFRYIILDNNQAYLPPFNDFALLCIHVSSVSDRPRCVQLLHRYNEAVLPEEHDWCEKVKLIVRLVAMKLI